MRPAMTAVVSAEEFSALQEQLMKLKEEKYEGIEREKKLKREIERLTKANTDTEALAKKNAGMLAMFRRLALPIRVIVDPADQNCLLRRRMLLPRRPQSLCAQTSQGRWIASSRPSPS